MYTDIYIEIFNVLLPALSMQCCYDIQPTFVTNMPASIFNVQSLVSQDRNPDTCIPSILGNWFSVKNSVRSSNNIALSLAFHFG